MFKEALIPSIGVAEMRVELDKKSLFALASDTRLDIMRSLQPMRRTVTQLAESLNIDKAAVHRHLKKLEEGGLVKRYEEHGFVYYGLSWKARDLMSPNENTRVIVMLSSSWILSILIVFLVLASLASFGNDGGNYSSGPTAGQGSQQSADWEKQIAGAQGTIPWFVFIGPAVALSAVAITLVVLSSKSMLRPKQPANGITNASDDHS